MLQGSYCRKGSSWTKGNKYPAIFADCTAHLTKK